MTRHLHPGHRHRLSTHDDFCHNANTDNAHIDMKHRPFTTSALLLAAAFIFTLTGCGRQIRYDISKMGAKGDGVTDNTEIINEAIRLCNAKGGGTVIVPAGDYLTGTIRLLSNVNLELADSARLLASSDLNAYGSYIPTKDMSRYDSGAGTSNQNCVSDSMWCRALIVASEADGASITGKGRIDGGHVTDPDGEENIRGPHTIIIAQSQNVKVEGISISRASNYAILAYDISDALFRHLNITEGWDGIHIRGGERTTIQNCHISTGDDCIAGGYWYDFNISSCNLNSSCNGIRMIMPSQKLTIENCRFEGPGKYAHRTSSEQGRPMLHAITLEPGGWGPAPGTMRKIIIRNCFASSVLSPLSVTLQDDNHCEDILVLNYKAKDCYRMAMSVKSWGSATTEKVFIRRCNFEFAGIDDPELPSKMEKLSFDQWPVFPSWGAYFRNVDSVIIENTDFVLTGKDWRKDIIRDNVPNYSRRYVMEDER